LSKLEVEKTNISDLKIDEPLSEQKWTGSILFLKKYVSSALKRLNEGSKS
jgi:hypothetical protein